MPARGWKKEDAKDNNIHIRVGECTNAVIESLMHKFGYTNKSKMILDLLMEAYVYHIDIPLRHSQDADDQRAALSDLKFFDFLKFVDNFERE